MSKDVYTRKSTRYQKGGFTLLELLVGVALLAMVSLSLYRGYVVIMQVLNASLDTITATDLANEQIEIIRNVPYKDVGVENSIPDGVLPKERIVKRAGRTFLVTTSVLNSDDPFDGVIGGNPNDTSSADYKRVQVVIECENCRNYTPIIVTTTVAPKALETTAGNGALFVYVFDASGFPVPQADINIVNNKDGFNIDINEVTNNEGVLQIVDAPTSTQAYEISVTKDGYTSAQTYTEGEVNNPDPLKTHATVVEGEVTEVSFAIDVASTLNVKSVTSSCSPVGNFDFNLRGSKIIGANPDVYKYDVTSSTNGSGALTLSGMEWDTYTATPADSAYTVAGVTPSPLVVSPGVTTDVSFIALPINPNHLLVTVLDSVTGLPLSSATTTLKAESGTEWVENTGRGFLSQTDWSGGSGQNMYAQEDRYSESDSTIEVDDPSGQITLKTSLGEYYTSGTLTSSTFDTGSVSNFHRLRFGPGSQPVEVGYDSVRIQFATSASSSPTSWDFIGPDGTSGSYYTVSDSTLSQVHNNDRYARYKIFLSTDDVNFTPNVSEISFTFTSDCVPAGQSFFQGKSLGDYTLNIEKDGYQTTESAVTIDEAWEHVIFNVSPDL